METTDTGGNLNGCACWFEYLCLGLSKCLGFGFNLSKFVVFGLSLTKCLAVAKCFTQPLKLNIKLSKRLS
jgi:hypothetical protein